MRGKPRPLPSLQYLNECFELDNNSPSGLKWKKRPRSHFKRNRFWLNFNKQYEGKFAGCQTNNYYRVGIDLKLYSTHRIVYVLYHQKEINNDVFIDHINRNKLDNRPENLRISSKINNGQNSSHSGNSGIRNVSRNGNKWEIRFRVNGESKRFGRYQAIEEAAARAREVSLELYGEFSPFYNTPTLDEQEQKRQTIRALIPSLNFRFHPVD